MKNILTFLCLLLFACPTKAQVPLLKPDSLGNFNISLDGEVWKFHAGDDARWAQPGYNDSSWVQTGSYMSVAAGKDKKIGFRGMGWFRYHFRVDSSLVNRPIAMSLDQGGASELFLDGKKILAYGTFSSRNNKPIYVSPRGEPTVMSFADTGLHVLAVRYENHNAAERFRRYDRGMAGFVIDLDDAAEGIESYYGSLQINSTLTLICGSIFLALCIVHFILFLFYREVRSNLWFSLFNLGFGLFFLLAFYGMNVINIARWDKVTLFVILSMFLSCFAISVLVNTLFTKKRLRLWLIAALCLTGCIAAFFKDGLGGWVLAVTAVICAVEAGALVCIAMYRKVKGSRIIGTGILFFVLFFGTITTVALISGRLQLQNGWLSVLILLLAVLAIFSIPFSMSAYLAWNFASVNKELKARLHEVGVLSKRSLEQEQEKQRMLENRKEELEAEVAHRTSEVLQQKGQIELQHEALKSEKQKSDELLLNILPAEVAEELKEKGNAAARNFSDVSVLFSDFVNFTHIAEELSPGNLVAELHSYFKVFDEIMERHGLEKIKTIGDAYLAVSGLPVASPDHAQKAVRAAMEMIAYVAKMKEQGHLFEVRIGINSGALVAGIVGVKKFAYDIWGDTVNMASRMESSSEAGKINVSGDTHQLIEHDFICTYRGKIEAKNKGEVDMYFVDAERTKNG